MPPKDPPAVSRTPADPPMAQPDDPAKETYVLSHLGLRTALGVIGLGLPFALILGVAYVDLTPWQSSISAHFYAPYFGPVFVGSLCAIGVFLMYYKGYPNRDDPYVVWPLTYEPVRRFADRFLTDNAVTTAAGIGAVGTALFPTCLDCSRQPLAEPCSEVTHLTFAALFFLSLTYMSLVQFTRSKDTRADMGTEKVVDNRIHLICGGTMAVCILLILAESTLPHQSCADQITSPRQAVFWLESFAVWAFAISWLIKGPWKGIYAAKPPGT